MVTNNKRRSAGDKAICDAAMKLKLVFSEKDFISRLGGDEFCIFLGLKKSIDVPKKIKNDYINRIFEIDNRKDIIFQY